MFYDKEKISCPVDNQFKSDENLFIYRYKHKYNLRLKFTYVIRYFVFFVGQKNVQHKQLESDTLTGLDIYTWQKE